MQDIELLARDKYEGDANRITVEDQERLANGEPLAYVIGWVPFLGLHIDLSTKPLIPRPETEWWAELLIERIGDSPLRVLDLCAGSGAIGLAVLKHCPNAIVLFGELSPEHAALITRNIEANGLDASRAHAAGGDLFAPFNTETFDIIATNPPYIPEGRALEASVTTFEPKEALYAGNDGLSLIRRIAAEAPFHVPNGELWMECDIQNIKEAAALLVEAGASRTDIRTDLYGRERLVLAYY